MTQQIWLNSGLMFCPCNDIVIFRESSWRNEENLCIVPLLCGNSGTCESMSFHLLSLPSGNAKYFDFYKQKPKVLTDRTAWSWEIELTFFFCQGYCNFVLCIVKTWVTWAILCRHLRRVGPSGGKPYLGYYFVLLQGDSESRLHCTHDNELELGYVRAILEQVICRIFFSRPY